MRSAVDDFRSNAVAIRLGMSKKAVLGADLANRLWSRVKVQPSGCWEFQGYRHWESGYGQIGTGEDRKITATHRAAWMVTYGAIPDGLFVLHKCDNRPCCNPDHLFLGTHTDNMRDMWAKGRGARETGVRTSNGRLTTEQVAEIRRRWVPCIRGHAETGNTLELAAEFGITPQYVSQLCRKVWRKAD